MSAGFPMTPSPHRPERVPSTDARAIEGKEVGPSRDLDKRIVQAVQERTTDSSAQDAAEGSTVPSGKTKEAKKPANTPRTKRGVKFLDPEQDVDSYISRIKEVTESKGSILKSKTPKKKGFGYYFSRFRRNRKPPREPIDQTPVQTHQRNFDKHLPPSELRPGHVEVPSVTKFKKQIEEAGGDLYRIAEIRNDLMEEIQFHNTSIEEYEKQGSVSHMFLSYMNRENELIRYYILGTEFYHLLDELSSDLSGHTKDTLDPQSRDEIKEKYETKIHDFVNGIKFVVGSKEDIDFFKSDVIKHIEKAMQRTVNKFAEKLSNMPKHIESSALLEEALSEINRFFGQEKLESLTYIDQNLPIASLSKYVVFKTIRDSKRGVIENITNVKITYSSFINKQKWLLDTVALVMNSSSIHAEDRKDIISSLASNNYNQFYELRGQFTDPIEYYFFVKLCETIQDNYRCNELIIHSYQEKSQGTLDTGDKVRAHEEPKSLYRPGEAVTWADGKEHDVLQKKQDLVQRLVSDEVFAKKHFPKEYETASKAKGDPKWDATSFWSEMV